MSATTIAFDDGPRHNWLLRLLLIGITILLVSTAISHAIGHGTEAFPQRFFCIPDAPGVESWYNADMDRCVHLVEYDDGRVGVRVIDRIKNRLFAEDEYEITSYWKPGWNNVRENLIRRGFECVTSGQ